MRLRSAGGRFLPILVLQLLLLHGLLLRTFSSAATVDASRLHERWSSRDPERQLQRSLARYRQLLQNNDDSRPDLVKPEEPETSAGQEETEEAQQNADGAVQNPERNVDEFEPVQKVELEGPHEDGKAEVLDNEERISEKTDEKNGDQDTKGTDPNTLNDEEKKHEKEKGRQEKQSQKEQEERVDKTREPNLNKEKLDEGKEQQTKEKDEQEEPKEDNVEKAEAEVEVESSAKTAEQQGLGEQQKEAEVQKNEDELKAESNPENQQQGEENQETEEQHEVQPTQEREDLESKIEENTSQKRNEPESKNEEEKPEEEKPVEEEPFVFPEPYLLGPTIKDWDEQRAAWLESNPHMKKKPDGKPRVLVVTGSQPNPCWSPVGDHFNLKSLKLKIDYARIHGYEIFYSLLLLDPLFNIYWVKLPIMRKLMLTHPEIEWFIWIDSDAIFTDMLFEAPFDTYEGINMVMWGYHHGFYVEKSWVAFNAGVFLIRNCQWSLDLFDKWSPMGPSGPVRNEYGKILTSFFSNRVENYAADDQSALAYLILTDEAVNSSVKLVDLNDYMVSAWWVEVVDNYETSMEKYHPGLGDYRWPWITHFTGCGPCNGDTSSPDYQKCMANIERALNFADNQVLAYMGFQHESLSSESLIRIRNESDRPLDFVGVNPWAERIAQLASAAA